MTVMLQDSYLALQHGHPANRITPAGAARTADV
jgi:hypothetical protein